MSHLLRIGSAGCASGCAALEEDADADAVAEAPMLASSAVAPARKRSLMTRWLMPPPDEVLPFSAPSAPELWPLFPADAGPTPEIALPLPPSTLKK
jgi:hypothetical protein